MTSFRHCPIDAPFFRGELVKWKNPWSGVGRLALALAGLAAAAAAPTAESAAASGEVVHTSKGRRWRQMRRADPPRRGIVYRDGLNGKQARARRARQIAAGSLRAENGLES